MALLALAMGFAWPAMAITEGAGWSAWEIAGAVVVGLILLTLGCVGWLRPSRKVSMWTLAVMMLSSGTSLVAGDFGNWLGWMFIVNGLVCVVSLAVDCCRNQVVKESSA